jgi:hypothetical protein
VSGIVVTASCGGVGGGSEPYMWLIDVRDEMKEIQERWYFLCLTPRREHVVGRMVLVILRLVVWSHKDTDSMPRRLNGVLPHTFVVVGNNFLETLNHLLLPKQKNDSRNRQKPD